MVLTLYGNSEICAHSLVFMCAQYVLTYPIKFKSHDQNYFFVVKYFFISSSDLPLVSGAMNITKSAETRQMAENIK